MTPRHTKHVVASRLRVAAIEAEQVVDDARSWMDSNTETKIEFPTLPEFQKELRKAADKIERDC